MIFDQYDALATVEDSQCYYPLRDSLGLPCCHIIQERLREKGILHLHGDTGPVNTSEPLLPNLRIVKGKSRTRGSRNRRNLTSTQREPSVFEVATQGQRRVLRPRSEPVREVRYVPIGRMRSKNSLTKGNTP